MTSKFKGITLLETLVSVVLMSVALATMMGIVSVRSKMETDIAKQYVVVEADAFLSDMYNDFYAADSINVQENGSTTTVTFDKGTSVNVYEYDSDLKRCFKNGQSQFKCLGMNVTASNTNLYVSLKFEGSNALELDIYK